MFVEAVRMPGCLILYTCGHENDWNTLIQWFECVSEYLWQYGASARPKLTNNLMKCQLLVDIQLLEGWHHIGLRSDRMQNSKKDWLPSSWGSMVMKYQRLSWKPSSESLIQVKHEDCYCSPNTKLWHDIKGFFPCFLWWSNMHAS